MSVPFRVAIDCSCLGRQWTGIAYYTYHLSRTLVEIRPDWDFLFFNGFGWRRDIPDPPAAALRLSRRLSPVLREIPIAYHAWRQMRRLCHDLAPRPFQPDVFLAPNHLPSGPCHPVIPIIHDLSHLRMPEAHPKGRLKWLNSLGPQLVHAPRIITVSEFTKTEVVSLLGVSPDRIQVANPGLAPGFSPPDESTLKRVLDGRGLRSGGYFLSLSPLEPRKNLSTLIAAHKALPPEFRRKWPLVVAGAAGWGSQTEWTLDEMILDIGYVSPSDLPALLAGAAALAYPSLYEGFGIPVIEAMACGAPVIASTAPGLDGAAGDAALRVPARDVSAWTTAMIQIVEDREQRHLCIQRGLAHAPRFTWQASASIVADVLEQARTNPRGTLATTE